MPLRIFIITHRMNLNDCSMTEDQAVITDDTRRYQYLLFTVHNSAWNTNEFKGQRKMKMHDVMKDFATSAFFGIKVHFPVIQRLENATIIKY